MGLMGVARSRRELYVVCGRVCRWELLEVEESCVWYLGRDMVLWGLTKCCV